MFTRMGLGSTWLTSKMDARVCSAGVRLPALVLLAVCFGCTKPAPVLPYCDHPGVTCSPHGEAPPEVQAEFVEQAWCCDPVEDPPCWPVEYLSACGPNDIAIYCEYGRSTPTGPYGFECYS